ncbi:MAG: peptidase S1 [Oceanicaulis sp.]
MVRIVTACAALAAAALTGQARAQDFALNPAYQTLDLSAGFSGDPRTVALQAGGANPAANAASGCAGFIADAPDVRVNYQAGAAFPLIISVQSGADTTLVINAPDSAWHCDDDGGPGVNPAIRFEAPLSGQYDIWVGTFSAGGLEDATLFISELSGH